MDPINFCYWLQGALELGHAQNVAGGLNAKQLQVIKDHLELVFEKVTPAADVITGMGVTPSTLEDLLKKTTGYDTTGKNPLSGLPYKFPPMAPGPVGPDKKYCASTTGGGGGER